MDEQDEYTDIIINEPTNYNTISQQPTLQSTNLSILEYDKNRLARIQQHINKITILISNQYSQLYYVDLLLWHDKYYYTYSKNICLEECCYDCCCCINYNPNYYFDNKKPGYGKCCYTDLYQESNYYIGCILCFLPCLPCLPIWIYDTLYRNCYGYSRTGFVEWIGNLAFKYCVCKCWENSWYLNILSDEMEEVCKLLQEKYSGILEVQMKKYGNNIKSISIRSLR